MGAAISLLRCKGDTDWQSAGACVDHDPLIFFPTRGEDVEPAKAICRACPVISDCLEWALVNVERIGVIGGTSERERRAIRHLRRCTVANCTNRAHDELFDAVVDAERRLGVTIAAPYRSAALWPRKRAHRRVSVRVLSTAS